jgi:hypothetical protein
LNSGVWIYLPFCPQPGAWYKEAVRICKIKAKVKSDSYSYSKGEGTETQHLQLNIGCCGECQTLAHNARGERGTEERERERERERVCVRGQK